MIKNLSQLKKAINEGKSFKILTHYLHPEFLGQIRKPTKVQTNGFFSVVENEPEHRVSLANGGKGYWAEYGKASDWTFENGVCKQNYRGREIWEIQFIDNGDEK